MFGYIQTHQSPGVCGSILRQTRGLDKSRQRQLQAGVTSAKPLQCKWRGLSPSLGQANRSRRCLFFCPLEFVVLTALVSRP